MTLLSCHRALPNQPIRKGWFGSSVASRGQLPAAARELAKSRDAGCEANRTFIMTRVINKYKFTTSKIITIIKIENIFTYVNIVH